MASHGGGPKLVSADDPFDPLPQSPLSRGGAIEGGMPFTFEEKNDDLMKNKKCYNMSESYCKKNIAFKRKKPHGNFFEFCEWLWTWKNKDMSCQSGRPSDSQHTPQYSIPIIRPFFGGTFRFSRLCLRKSERTWRPYLQGINCDPTLNSPGHVLISLRKSCLRCPRVLSIPI